MAINDFMSTFRWLSCSEGEPSSLYNVNNGSPLPAVSSFPGLCFLSFWLVLESQPIAPSRINVRCAGALKKLPASSHSSSGNGGTEKCSDSKNDFAVWSSRDCNGTTADSAVTTASNFNTPSLCDVGMWFFFSSLTWFIAGNISKPCSMASCRSI
eukprot:Lithocolla_globosa_v1_NODE_1924_length_2258_cov_3.798003.p2 type:complete len:155 gc:universal NODE_1924_length_2258_cov_3.798003:974-510(-)